MAKVKKSNVPFKEWVWYLIGGLLAAWGIGEIICGLILEYSTGTVAESPLFEANKKFIELFGLSFLHWGLILLAIGTIVSVIVLCVTASTFDRESEKQSRRAARLRVKHQDEMVEEALVSEAAASETDAQ